MMNDEVGGDYGAGDGDGSFAKDKRTDGRTNSKK